ncbi:hypothetical protein Slin15195_G093840 [Septoria linicola]|uniref:DUF6594 domain-containing protein n=1 Tax=Septoria linicola TaxID=215465 RepID=A0A9Q9B0R8_9PEZI|nr:hypothetical protein Slin15195_G093840 [Septoria linicola]
MEDNHDSHSAYSSSSSSSHYQASDAGSSELPDTPSSHSTCPSPTATRSRSVSGSVAELRRRYDPQYASSVDSRSSGSQSPEADRSPPRSIKKLPQLRDVAESDEHDSDAGASFNEVVYDARQRSSSHSYAAQLPPPPLQPRQPHGERLKAQQDALREHVAQDQQRNHHHRVDSAYGQHRSHSSSSTRSVDSQRAWAQHIQGMQMQQYQQCASPAIPMAYPVPYHNINGHIAPPPPPAPDAPDNTIQTITGYELLAQELSNQDSPVKPMYRRFEYLNHRILLHMQDELQELEEQLRIADEIIARADPSLSPSHPSDSYCPPSGPSSRRTDRNHGTHWHHQRTELLGRIFLKTRDYNAAVSSFASMLKESSAAAKEDVDVYRSWMREKDVICEVERKFLDVRGGDLVRLGGGEKEVEVVAQTKKKKDAARSNDEDRSLLFAGLALLPILPLVLFSIISTLAGRLVVTVLFTLGAVLLARNSSSSTAAALQLVQVLGLSPQQTHMAVAGCMLLCCGFAGCVPL